MKDFTRDEQIQALAKHISQLEGELFKNENGETNYTTTSGRKVLILNSILRELVPQPDKPTGVKWEQDKIGGFKMDLYICAADFQNLKLPTQEAEAVEKMMKQKASCYILSAMAVIFSFWHRERMADQRRIMAEVERTTAH